MDKLPFWSGGAELTGQMKYAILDIETTGISYKNGKITEIAILIHDGKAIVDEFATLINPEQKKFHITSHN